MSSWRKTNLTHASATGDIWVNSAQGLVLWYEQGKYRMRAIANGVGLGVVVDGSAALASCPWLHNSHQVFSASTLALYDFGGSYALAPAFLANLAEWQEESVYYGTAWWSLSGTSPIGTYTARGSGHGGATRAVAWETFNGWSSSTLAGDYAAEGSASGTKHFGWRLLNCGSVYWVEAAGRLNSQPTYHLIGAIPANYPEWLWYNGSAWVSSSAVGATSAPYRVGGAAAAGTYSDPNSVLDPITNAAYTGSTNAAYRTLPQSDGTLYLGNIAACL